MCMGIRITFLITKTSTDNIWAAYPVNILRISIYPIAQNKYCEIMTDKRRGIDFFFFFFFPKER